MGLCEYCIVERAGLDPVSKSRVCGMCGAQVPSDSPDISALETLHALLSDGCFWKEYWDKKRG